MNAGTAASPPQSLMNSPTQSTQSNARDCRPRSQGCGARRDRRVHRTEPASSNPRFRGVQFAAGDFTAAASVPKNYLHLSVLPLPDSWHGGVGPAHGSVPTISETRNCETPSAPVPSISTALSVNLIGNNRVGGKFVRRPSVPLAAVHHRFFRTRAFQVWNAVTSA